MPLTKVMLSELELSQVLYVRCEPSIFFCPLVWIGRKSFRHSYLIPAKACGCNVVNTDCRQEPLNLNAQGRYGSVAPAGDAPALARAMLERLDNPLPPGQLRSRAAPYGLDQMASHYLELLLPGWEQTRAGA